MSRRKPVDELAVLRLTRQLDQHRSEHPEAFDPDRLPATASEVNVALARLDRRGPKPK